MFASIKWRFTVIYFILIFIAMLIFGMFIVVNLEKQQTANIIRNMEITSEALLSASSFFAEDDWSQNSKEIQSIVDAWRVAQNESLYVIDMQKIPTIVATSVSGVRLSDIYSNRMIDPILVETVENGERGSVEKYDYNSGKAFQHFALPVFSNSGEIKGIIYMTSDLEQVYQAQEQTINTIVVGILIALIITLGLGFIIANSITEPIRDVTEKAELMAEGDFNQTVDVKSNDEIGQLAIMFNYLTGKLNMTLQEMSLEKSKLDKIFEYMTEGVVAVHVDGTIIHANPIAVKILGYNNAEECHGRFFPRAILDLESVFNIEDNEEKEERLLTINNLVYKVKHAIFKNDENSIGGVIIVFQDMTKEHKLDEIRKEFVANVSHELKTPLTTVKTYTETLLESEVDRDTEKSFLSVIDKECDRMTKLVRDLLELSNIDYDRSRWKFDSVSLKAIVEDVLRKLDYSANTKGHELNFECEADIPNIDLDSDAIERVIINIVSNSIKYTENGGKIDVKLSTDGNYAVLSVKDNGLGIPKEDLDRVFERFYRVEKGRSREMGGTGLGLSIAKEIVEGHSGTISMDSEFGKGTETTIRLPF